jgi:hypothetical protein
VPRTLWLLPLLAACGEVNENRHLDGGTDASGDASPDARLPTCWGAPFAAGPQPVVALNGTMRDAFLRLSGDELTAYFSRDIVGASAVLSGFTASRTTATGTFGTPIRLVINGDTALELWSPTVTADGKTLYFTRTNGAAGKDIYKATRNVTSDNFSGITAVTELNSSSADEDVYVVPDGSAIYFSSDRGNGNTFSIFRAALNGASFSPPVEVLADTSLFVNRVVISPDELTMFYQGGNEIHETRRASKTAMWSLAPAIGVLGSMSADHPTWVSADGCRLYLESDRTPTTGALDLYLATRTAQ